MTEKRDSPSQKSIHNHLQNCPNFRDLSPPFICFCEKVNIVFIVNKLILIYFSWFVYTFVNYNYNVSYKRCVFNAT